MLKEVMLGSTPALVATTLSIVHASNMALHVDSAVAMLLLGLHPLPAE